MAHTEAHAEQRILVIDDDHAVADSFVMLLKTCGSTARTAYSGAAGIEALTEFKPAVVFLDIGMPGMDGYETARRIRALPEGRRVKLVALTAFERDRVEDSVRDAGFDHHLTKPAPFESLCDLLWCKFDCGRSLQSCPLLSMEFCRKS
jgi:CheY-like chemotaxis protein